MTCPPVPYPPAPSSGSRAHENGNIFFIILLAIVLIGLLTVAIQSSTDTSSSNVDKELLALRAGEVQRAAAEFERAVRFIIENGHSESTLRFSHPDASANYGVYNSSAETEIFNPAGGAASYHTPSSGIQTTAAAWEFFGGTAVPGIGTSKADLVAVLPNVTQQFCEKINVLNNQSAQPLDTGAVPASGTTTAGNCVFMASVGRFGDGTGDQFYATPNTMDTASFAQDSNTSAVRPAPQACVQCDIGPAYHFYHVLLAR